MIYNCRLLSYIALLLAPLVALHLYGAPNSDFDRKTATRKVTCCITDAVKTVTFILNNAHFPGKSYTGLDLQIRALKGDAVIRFVRVIKLD